MWLGSTAWISVFGNCVAATCSVVIQEIFTKWTQECQNYWVPTTQRFSVRRNTPPSFGSSKELPKHSVINVRCEYNERHRSYILKPGIFLTLEVWRKPLLSNISIKFCARYQKPAQLLFVKTTAECTEKELQHNDVQNRTFIMSHQRHFQVMSWKCHCWPRCSLPWTKISFNRDALRVKGLSKLPSTDFYCSQHKHHSSKWPYMWHSSLSKASNAKIDRIPL